MTTQVEAYAALGQVVANSQFFEFAFLACAKLTLKQGSVADLAEVAPLSLGKSFKQPTISILNELRLHVQLNPDFEARLQSVVERRHELIHRWLLARGWPDDSNESGLSDVTAYANQVSQDLNAITRILIESIVAWLDRFPQTRGMLYSLGSDWRTKLPPEYRSLTIRSS